MKKYFNLSIDKDTYNMISAVSEKRDLPKTTVIHLAVSNLIKNDSKTTFGNLPKLSNKLNPSLKGKFKAKDIKIENAYL